MKGIKPHPARFPADLPEYFVRMLTDEGDAVLDPFGGSCVTGEVCERLGRKWVCSELEADYLQGALGRFQRPPIPRQAANPLDDENYYRVPRPGILWNGTQGQPLPQDGGKTRPDSVAKKPVRLPRRKGKEWPEAAE